MKRDGRGIHSRAALVVACAALAGFAACSRTDDPFERYASSHVGSNAGKGGNAAVSGSAGKATAGGSPGSAGSVAAGGSGGSAGSEATGTSGTTTAGGGSGPDPVDVCGDPPVSSGPFTKRALRAAAADCADWHYCRFESAAGSLSSAIDEYATTPDDDTLDVARSALAQAMDVWSEVELFQFGPLASSSEAAGRDMKQGKGIRDLIYAWPATVRTRVEEQVVNRNYLNSWASDVVLVSARGLFSLDYLLSYQGHDTVCTPSSVCGKNWAKHSAEDIASLKRDYAAAAAADIVQRITELRGLWAEDGGNFRPLFVDASGYDDELQAMTALAWSLLYVEREVKDYKLGVPAGYTLTSPVSLPEMPYSGRASDNIRHNLRGFRALFQGCGKGGEGVGLDDWLTEAGHPELAQDIIRAWQGAQAAADAFPAFAAASPAELEALYRAVKALTDLLKSDLFGSGSPLGLTLPKGIEGDTD